MSVEIRTEWSEDGKTIEDITAFTCLYPEDAIEPFNPKDAISIGPRDLMCHVIELEPELDYDPKYTTGGMIYWENLLFTDDGEIKDGWYDLWL
jgi:hypothetical protein